MEGIQKFTEHAKVPAAGPSISIIFRKLTPATYSSLKMKRFNIPFEVPWHDLMLTEQHRKIVPKSFDYDVAMHTYWPSRNEFNVACRHPQLERVLCSDNGTATSLYLRKLDAHKLNSDASQISYFCNNKHYSGKALKQCDKLGRCIRVYAPCNWFVVMPKAKNGILFLGFYSIIQITNTTNYEFVLSRNE